MPRVTTIDEAHALVGTTWERDGKRRFVHRVEAQWLLYLDCHVHWSRPGETATRETWITTWNDWMSGATRVEAEPCAN